MGHIKRKGFSYVLETTENKAGRKHYADLGEWRVSRQQGVFQVVLMGCKTSVFVKSVVFNVQQTLQNL